VLSLPTEHYEYCVKAEGAAQSTCWTRGPDMEYCNKVPPPGRAAGSFTTGPVDAAAASGGQKTRWITLACLNAGTYPMFSDGPFPPCASGDPTAASYSAHAASAISSYTP
jgi:hypothetical protein